MTDIIKTYLRRALPKSDFARSVSILVGGTAGAQALTVLAAPFLTRLYTPQDFGLLAVYASLLAMIIVLSSLRYELAIPLPEDDTEAGNVLGLSLLLVALTACVIGVVVAIFGTQISNALGAPSLSNYLWLLPVGVLFGGAYNTFRYWAVRKKQFKTVAVTKLRQAVTTVVIQMSAFKLGGVALLYAQVAGQSAGTASLGRLAWSDIGIGTINFRGILAAASRYRRFPMFSTWAGLANTAGLQLPPILLAAFFGPAATGLYVLAHRVLMLPMSLVGSAIGQVFFSNAAEAHRKGELSSLVAGLHSRLAQIGMAPALILALLGPDLFAFAFGENWRQSGEIVRFLAPWLYLVLVTSPFSTVSTVTERQKQGLVYHITQLSLRVLAISVGGWLGDFETTIILYAIASTLSRLGYLIWIAHISGTEFRKIWQPTLTALAFAVFSTLPIFAGLLLGGFSPVTWAVSITISLVLVASRYWYILREAY